jgi:hypothetical protein
LAKPVGAAVREGAAPAAELSVLGAAATVTAPGALLAAVLSLAGAGLFVGLTAAPVLDRSVEVELAARDVSLGAELAPGACTFSACVATGLGALLVCRAGAAEPSALAVAVESGSGGALVGAGAGDGVLLAVVSREISG